MTECAAKEIISKAMDPLSDDERARVIRWAVDRFAAQCGAVTDGLAATGKPGDLVCVKPLGHPGTHRSIEGAIW